MVLTAMFFIEGLAGGFRRETDRLANRYVGATFASELERRVGEK